jgi:hypothetical protein
MAREARREFRWERQSGPRLDRASGSDPLPRWGFFFRGYPYGVFVAMRTVSRSGPGVRSRGRVPGRQGVGGPVVYQAAKAYPGAFGA